MVEEPVDGADQVGFGQAAVLEAEFIDAGVEGLDDVGGGVQTLGQVSV